MGYTLKARVEDGHGGYFAPDPSAVFVNPFAVGCLYASRDEAVVAARWYARGGTRDGLVATVCVRHDGFGPLSEQDLREKVLDMADGRFMAAVARDLGESKQNLARFLAGGGAGEALLERLGVRKEVRYLPKDY